MSYRIASFNVHNLSLASKRNLERIAQIIRENQIDIVALQEVLSEGKALSGMATSAKQPQGVENKFLKHYLPGWQFYWCDPKVHAKDYPYLGKDSRGEGYAFMWNSRVELPTDDRGIVYPRIIDSYKVNAEDGQIRLIRNPCYGRFRLKQCKAEIRLINTHIVYGKPKDGVVQISGAEALLDAGAIAMRRREFDILAGKIYRQVNEYRKEATATAVTTILLGDYNLNLFKPGEKRSAQVDMVALFDKSGRRTLVEPSSTIFTLQDELTTLKQDGPGFANNYDHFSVDEQTMPIICSVKAIQAVSPEGIPSDQDFETYKKTVSDHIPIMIEIDLRRRS